MDEVDQDDPRTDAEREDDEIVKEAKKRFDRCEEYEANARKLFLHDVKFANADPDNGYQWPNEIRINRDLEERPCLTVNKTRQHNLQIINDAKQNKPSIKVRPANNEASFQAAQVYEGVIRHIEYISNAQAAYDTATKFQVDGGLGFWRVVTDYFDQDTFDQEIFIRRIKDPLSVYTDPDANEADKSDMRFGFIFDDMPKELFNEAYPDYKDIAGQAALGNGDGWIDDEHVRVCEYFRIVPKKDQLLAIVDKDTGEITLIRRSKLPKEAMKEILDDPTTKMRDVVDNQVEWYLIAGSKIIDRRDWPGIYIPIIPLIGEETIINGELDRKGHTRNLKDPQRIYNYWTSSAVEFVCLQGKSPYIAPVKAIEGLETYWETANRINHAVLPYNNVDDDGNVIPPPQRQEPPVMAAAYVQGMQISAQEMEFASGQYEATFGAPGQELSGRAINERNRRGDKATYGFIDNLGLSIRYTGKIIMDLIPKVYDTKRVIRILGADGVKQDITVDPALKQAAVIEKGKVENSVNMIFNPTVGRYDVEADIGPAYATKRQEAFNAFSQIAVSNPDLMNIIGDLLFKNADFPGADKIAERLERLVPPEAKGEGTPPAVLAAQQQVQTLQSLLEQSMQALSEERLKSRDHSEENEIKMYDGITKRIAALLPTMVNPKDIAQMVHDLMKAEHSNELNMQRMAMQPTQIEAPQ